MDMLRRRTRVSRRALRRQFGIDEEFLDDVLFELVDTLGVAELDDTGVLTWTGTGSEAGETDASAVSASPGSPGVAALERAVTVPSEKVSPPLPKHSSSEYRQLTVLFSDLVGSTRLASTVGPERFAEVIDAYQACARKVVQAQDGHIGQYLGDGIVVYFGYPHTHEDEAERAVRAGLALVEEMEGTVAEHPACKDLDLEVRVGIHTGIAVVGGMGGDRQVNMALGDVPNLAARLQELARPGSVVVSKQTYSLVGRRFECVPRGKHSVKGLVPPIRIFEVLRELDTGDSDGMRDSRVRLVGRDSEIGLLKDRWQRAGGGMGQVVAVSGEAGIGKTRLVNALMEHVDDQGAQRITLTCSSYTADSTLQPLIDFWTRRLELSETGLSPDQALDRIESMLAGFGLKTPGSVALTASLLSIPLGTRYASDGITTPRERRETLDLIVRLLLGMARRTPLLIAWEDLQWADPTSLELIGRLCDEIAREPVMVVCTFRPEFTAPWQGRSHVASLTLSRLTRDEVVNLVREVAGVEIHRAVLDQLVNRTDGVPLFIEEVTKLLIETKSLHRPVTVTESGDVGIPASLRDSLMARLDRLGAAKRVAQIAAVIGRDFPSALINAVWTGAPEDLRDGLAALVDAELVYTRTRPEGRSYSFKHALLLDVAYESMLRKRRRTHHARVLEVLEAEFPEYRERQPELLARHAASADLPGLAIRYWRRAGERALSLSAHVEAIAHLRRALELLDANVDLDDHASSELAVQTSLAVAYTAVKGYGAPEVTTAYDRARSLCERVGGIHELFPVLYGLCRSYMLRARYDVALELADQVTKLAAETRDPEHQVAANRAAGSVLFYRGRISESLERLRLVTEASRAVTDSVDVSLYVVDPVAASHSYASWVLLLKGEEDLARAESDRAIDVATERNHPFSVALAHSFAAWFHQMTGDPERTARSAEAALEVSHQHEFGFWFGWNRVMLGWARAVSGDHEGLEEVQRGLDHWKAVGSELGLCYFHLLLADALAAAERFPAAQVALDDAFVLSEEAGEGWCLPELHRLQAVLSMSLDPEDRETAEARFRMAMEAAAEMGSPWHGLRAAVGLAQALQGRGEDDDASVVLRASLEGLPPGGPSREEAEARRLLAQVSGQPTP